MERLRSKEARKVLEFLCQLYTLRNHDTFSSHVISSLSALFPSDVSSYNELIPSKNLAIYKIWPTDFPLLPHSQEIFGLYQHQSPLVHNILKTGQGQPHKISDFMTHREFRRTDLYNLFYRPMYLPHTLGLGLSLGRGVLLAIGFHRGGKDYSEQERSMVSVLYPHLLQAHANAQAVTLMQAEIAQLKHAVEHIPQGLISVDARGRIQWATDQARRLLTEYFGAGRSSHHRLPDLLARWMRYSKAQFDRAHEQPNRIAPIVIKHGSRQLHVRTVPDGDHCLLFLEEAPAEISVEQLAHLGLSRRETEILGWIVRGKSNPEIAMILSISVRTIHTHVEHIYHKLGVENRHAAMVLALETMQRGRLGKGYD